MANRSYLNLEDELADGGELIPESSISDRVPTPDFFSDAMARQGGSDETDQTTNPVASAIMQRRSAPALPPVGLSDAQDPLMQRYEQDQKNLDSYRQAKRGSDFVSNLGQAFNTLAQGSNAPRPTGLFDQMGKQSSEMLKSNEEDLDRRQKIVNAIEARKGRQEAESGRREDRNLARDQIQATRDLARSDKQEKEAKISEKQAETVKDFNDSLDGIGSLIGQLGDHSEWTGPVDGRIPDALVGADQVAFRSELGRMVDKYRKAITGAGASNQELARLESRLPQPTDTFQNFLAKAKGLQGEIQRNRGSYMQLLSAQGKNTVPFEKGPTSLQKESTKGKVIVTNGKETYAIDADDVADAEKDGFRRQ